MLNKADLDTGNVLASSTAQIGAESKSYRYFSQIFTGAKFPIVMVFYP